MEPVFFDTPAAFRAWLEANHATEPELVVGFHKVGSGLPSITWPEAVEEALCFGWIDGIRRSLDATSYTNRFTPRRKRSTWSARNIATVARLAAEGRMTPAGLAAFEARTEDDTGIYSFEQSAEPKLEPAQERTFKANREAWAWFRNAAPSYRRGAIHWVRSAKRPETRGRRLAQLIEDSAAGRTVRPLTTPSRRKD